MQDGNKELTYIDSAVSAFVWISLEGLESSAGRRCIRALPCNFVTWKAVSYVTYSTVRSQDILDK